MISDFIRACILYSIDPIWFHHKSRPVDNQTYRFTLVFTRVTLIPTMEKSPSCMHKDFRSFIGICILKRVSGAWSDTLPDANQLQSVYGKYDGIQKPLQRYGRGNYIP